ncbi:Muramoyltetrapeptide carboxypeptidase [hydrothermal vent metagenome]|uniref:Muramoyltetrapeptide carboxypeptidase n=1 Tax=hydrothermal vent metagenome TaxID=652676 RepID=A0A3B0UFE2_9ZZZZ
MSSPPYLKKGDAIGLVAPARRISEQELTTAVEIIESRGYKVVKGKYLFASENQFAGTDEKRAADMQQMIENPEVKAVFAVRGGYGSVRIVDKIDFRPLLKNPKRLAGYSDFTVFHNHLINMEIQSLHATMPLNFADNTPEALDSLFRTLEGEKPQYQFASHPLNRKGKVGGMLVGGNLSVLYSLMGSRSFPDTTGKILFLEDLDEYLYHIDRMMMALKRAGMLKNLAGLVVGGMTKMNDNSIPFGKTAEEIIRESVEEYGFPVAFGFPAGHQPDNRTLIMGAEVQLEVKEDSSEIDFK